MGIGIGLQRRRDAGFSLLEMLVVVAVLAILTVSVGLSMSFGRTEKRAMDQARQIQTHVEQLRNKAIYSGQPQGMVFSRQGWQVARFDPATRNWSKAGREIHWRGGVSFQGGDPDFIYGHAPVPDVIFLPDGHATPFEISFTVNGSYQACRSDGWRGLECPQ